MVGDGPGGKRRLFSQTLANVFVGVIPRVLDRFMKRIEKRVKHPSH
jgi:hypothetical protein